MQFTFFNLFITNNWKRWRGGRSIEMKNQLWKYWKGHCYQLLYCATKKNCYSAECLETIQGRGICSLILSPPTTGHLATYVASPLGICHPSLKKGKGRGRGRKMRKGKGTLSPQFLPWLCANPGHARAATDVDVFETFASVYKHHNHFNHFKSKVNILWRTSLWFDI